MPAGLMCVQSCADQNPIITTLVSAKSILCVGHLIRVVMQAPHG